MSDDDDSNYKILTEELGEVFAQDYKQGVVTIRVFCDDLLPGNHRTRPKNGSCDVWFSPDCESFEIKLKITNEKKKTKTKYFYKMRKLPSKIVRERSTWDIQKGMIVFKLQKEEENLDWTPMVKARGIDQLASDESS